VRLLGATQDVVVTPAELAETMRLMERERGRRRPSDRFFQDSIRRADIQANRFIEWSGETVGPQVGINIGGDGEQVFQMSDQGGAIVKIQINPTRAPGGNDVLAFSTQPDATPTGQDPPVWVEVAGLVWRTTYTEEQPLIREWRKGFPMSPGSSLYISDYGTTLPHIFLSIDVFDAGQS